MGAAAHLPAIQRAANLLAVHVGCLLRNALLLRAAALCVRACLPPCLWCAHPHCLSLTATACFLLPAGKQRNLADDELVVAQMREQLLARMRSLGSLQQPAEATACLEVSYSCRGLIFLFYLVCLSCLLFFTNRCNIARDSRLGA